jgi:hypothetical protein
MHARIAQARLDNLSLDYKIHPERYIAGELPRLSFADGEFDLILVSYSLFA